MSQGEKYPLKMARAIAEKMVEKLQPYCEKIEIAGSIRRQRPEVGDIEIVAISKSEDRPAPNRSLFDMSATAPVSLLWENLDGLLAAGKIQHPEGSKAWGDRYRKFTVETNHHRQFKFDLFSATPENWGMILLIRTGPADYSRLMVTQKRKGGYMPEGMEMKGGMLYRHGRVLAVPTEQAAYAELGVQWVDPALRH